MLSVSVFANPRARRRLLVSHGNGLAVFGYRVFWEALRADFEVITLDMRGHGSSEPGEPVMHETAQFVRDLQSVLVALRATDPRPIVGAFHSLSGIVGLMHLAAHEQAAAPPWDALVLFDPPLEPPVGEPLRAEFHAEMETLAQVTARRRRVYASVEERERQFLRSDVFGPWEPGAALDMAQATLRPFRNKSGSLGGGRGSGGVDDRREGASAGAGHVLGGRFGGSAPASLTRDTSPSGRWQLSCDPALESAVYRTAGNGAPWQALAQPSCPVLLIGADPNSPRAEAPAKAGLLAHQRLGVAHEWVPRTGHFLQMEQPAACRQLLLDFVRRL